MNMAYGLGASVVIIGALFKIMHWPGASPMLIAGLVTWPIIVLKAKEVIAPIETPLERVLVSKISAGMIHERVPQVNENEIW